MKKFFAAILAVIMVMAACPIAFAEDWIELVEIYDTYGYGEEIYIGGTVKFDGAVIAITSSDGRLKFYLSVDGKTLEEGIYVGIDETWNIGEYSLMVSYDKDHTVTKDITIQEEKVDRTPSKTENSTSGNKTSLTATDISVSKTELSMEVGETEELTAKGERASYKWVTDDDDKITVTGATSAAAKITAKKTGTAVLWVYCGNNYATVTITITPSTKKEEIKTEPEKKEENENKNEPEKNEEADMFTDISDFTWAKESINSLAKAEVINGMGNGIFAPEQNVTRAQFVKMIVEAFDFEGKGDVSFTDINGDEWYADVVLVAANNGVVNGYDGRFSPNANISCRDAALIVSRVLSMKNIELKNAPSSEAFDGADYALEAVQLLAGNGIITEEMGFASQKQATRAQSAYLIYGAYKLR